MADYVSRMDSSWRGAYRAEEMGPRRLNGRLGLVMLYPRLNDGWALIRSINRARLFGTLTSTTHDR